MKKTQKNSKGEPKNWNKVLFVAVALMIAVAMVGTYLSPIFNQGRKAEAGDIAAIDYTIYDMQGRPVLSTDQALVSAELQRGHAVVLSSGIEIPVGMAVSMENVADVPILYPKLEGFSGFGLLGFELNAISAGIIGMRPGETKAIPLDYGGNPLEMNLSAEDAAQIGINATDVGMGDMIPLGFTTTPDILPDENTTISMRFGEITGKSEDSLTIRYRYQTASVTLHTVQQG